MAHPSIFNRINSRRQLSFVISTFSSKSNAKNLYLNKNNLFERNGFWFFFLLVVFTFVGTLGSICAVGIPFDVRGPYHVWPMRVFAGKPCRSMEIPISISLACERAIVIENIFSNLHEKLSVCNPMLGEHIARNACCRCCHRSINLSRFPTTSSGRPWTTYAIYALASIGRVIMYSISMEANAMRRHTFVALSHKQKKRRGESYIDIDFGFLLFGYQNCTPFRSLCCILFDWHLMIVRHCQIARFRQRV